MTNIALAPKPLDFASRASIVSDEVLPSTVSSRVMATPATHKVHHSSIYSTALEARKGITETGVL